MVTVLPLGVATCEPARPLKSFSANTTEATLRGVATTKHDVAGNTACNETRPASLGDSKRTARQRPELPEATAGIGCKESVACLDPD